MFFACSSMLSATFKLFIILASICLIHGQMPRRVGISSASRIVGGYAAVIKDYPYLVSLQDTIFGHICGASMISKTFIITAAHCIYKTNPKQLVVRVGSTYHRNGGKKMRIKSVISHRGYNPKSTDYDIGVLELTTEIPPKYYFPINLPESETGPPDKATAVVAGWGSVLEGRRGPENLRSLKVPIINQKDCVKLYGSDITDRMFCAGYLEGGRDACQGDSGGPLVVGKTLYGLVSWGEGCARANSLGVYTNVALFRDWIRKNSRV